MELLNAIKLGTMGFKPSDIKQFNESGIDSEQVIELAKAGYKAEDVSELIKLASMEPKPEPPTPPATLPDDAGKEAGETKAQEDIDKLRKELEEEKAKLVTLQKQNAQKNLGPDKTETPRQTFQNALRSLY